MKNYWLDKIQSGKIGMQTDDRNYDKLLCNLSVEGEKALLKHLLNKYKNDEEVLNAINFLETTLEKKSTVTGQILPFPSGAVHHHIPSTIRLDAANVPSTITIAGNTLGHNCCYPCSSVSSSSFNGSPPFTPSFTAYSYSSSSSMSCSACSSSSSSSSCGKYIVGGDAAIAADLVIEAECPKDDMPGVADLLVLAETTTDLTLWNDYQYVSNEESNLFSLGYIHNALNAAHYYTTFRLAHTPVLRGTLTGTVYVGAEAIQTFIVSAQGVFTFKYVSPWTAESAPHSVKIGSLNLETGEVKLIWAKRPEYPYSGEPLPIKLVTSYEYKFNGEI
jgi:hypothetical protein